MAIGKAYRTKNSSTVLTGCVIAEQFQNSVSRSDSYKDIIREEEYIMFF